MTPKARSESAIAFGPFEFERATGELRKFGVRIRIQGKPVQILACLISEPNRIVTRDELKRELWPGTTVEFEQGLNTAINKLRQALGDSADQPRYIETLPGRGYRFIGPIQPPRPPKLVELPVIPARPRSNWLAIATIAALAAISLAGYLWYASDAKPLPSRPVTITVTPPRGYGYTPAVNHTGLALAPDGDSIAFLADDNGGSPSLFLRRFDAIDSIPIASSASVATVFWHPDDKSILAASGLKLRKFSLDGQPEQTFGDLPGASNSGTALHFDRFLIGGHLNSYLVTTAGAVEPLKEVYGWPQLLPDGKRVLHVIWDPKLRLFSAHAREFGNPDPGPALVESRTKVMFTMSPRNSSRGYLVYGRGSNLMAQPVRYPSLRKDGDAVVVAAGLYTFTPTGASDFTTSARGDIAYFHQTPHSQLAWVDRSGRQISTIGPSGVNLRSGRLSRDGKWIATAIFDLEAGQQDLWIIDTATGDSRRLSGIPVMRDVPVWSPDGTHIAYLYSGGGGFPKTHIRTTGVEDIDLTAPGDGFQLPTDWSPDGRYVLISNTGFAGRARDYRADIWLLDTRGNLSMQPMLTSKFHELGAAFSPDGKWVAFVSDESGESEVYVQRFDGGVSGPRYRVTRKGAITIRWRRDGKELFYLARDGHVHAVPVALNATPTFGRDETLFAISPEARSAIHSALGFDVSASGKRFLVPTVAGDREPHIVVIRDWEAHLSSRRN